MPRNDDDFDDDRPRRRPPRDDHEQDRPARSRRRPDDEEDDRPVRRRRDQENDDLPPPRKKKSNLALILTLLGVGLVLLCGGGLVGIYFLGDQLVGGDRDRQKSSNNLKQIGLAFHNHADARDSLPNNTYGPDGKPLLSWRVHILPFIEQDNLYRQFNLNEPWDGPTNRPLIAQMPSVYGTSAMQKRAGQGKTYYRGFSHQGAIFEKPRQAGFVNRLRINNLPDGTSNTIFVVEADEAIEWTKPDDLDFGPGKPLPSLGAGRNDKFVTVLMGDGSVRVVRKANSESAWRAAIGYQDGEVVFLE
jgi:hypothetical protein